MVRTTTTLAVLGTAFALSFAAPAIAASAPPAYATAAVNDASRPADDKKVDADRKPAEMVVFAGLKPGDKVVDLLPGGGYFTRVFAKVVGAKGHVYAMVPDEMVKLRATAADPIKAIADDKSYGNVSVVTGPIATFKVDAPVDVVWTSRNYHDLHNKMFGSPDMAAFNKAVFAALKPGGTYIVLDHAAAPGSGFEATEALHRVDPEAVKKEVTAAGFQFVSADDTLKSTADDHTGKVFDANVRGKTDQFVLKFKKP